MLKAFKTWLHYFGGVVLLLFLGFGSLAQAPTFVASASASRVSLNTYFEVVFTLKGAEIGQFSPPSFGKLKVVGGPNRSSSYAYVNGKMSAEQSVGFQLIASQVGTYTIPAATMKTRSGQTLTAKPLVIEVVSASSPPNNNALGGGMSTATKIAESVFVRAEVAKRQVYTGEQVVVTYKLYTSISLDEVSVMSDPDFSSNYVIPHRKVEDVVLNEVVNGVPYRTKVLGRFSVFPQQSGTLSIPPIAMKVVVYEGRNTNIRDPLLLMLQPMQPIVREVRSEPVNIEVMPLPPAPAGFSGALGDYSFDFQADRNNLTTDDVLLLTLTADGNGDSKRFLAPDLDFGDSIEVFAPTVEERQYEQNGEIRFAKSFRYPLIPRQTGELVLRPAVLSFSTEKAAYEVFSSTIPVRVALGKKPLGMAASPQANQKDTQAPRDIKNDYYTVPPPFYNTLLFWAIVALPVLLLLGLWFLGWRRGQNNEQRTLKNQEQQAIAVLLEALTRLEPPRDTTSPAEGYSALHKAVRAFLQHSGKEAELARWQPILQRCDQARFGGAATADDFRLDVQLARRLAKGEQA